VHRALLLSAAALVLAPLALGAGNATSNTTFTYGTYTDVMVGWDPSTSYSNEILAMQNMYETLTRYNAKTKKIDPLASRSIPDGR
jgi:peptide/nickel transport system substrate-binding protein